MNLQHLPVGSSARVTGYVGNDQEYRHKLLRMGLTKGVEIRLLRKAPLGDPIEIEVRGFKLTLRKAEASALEVEASLGTTPSGGQIDA